MKAIYIEPINYDNETLELCRLYWQIDDNGELAYALSDLAKQFGVGVNQISTIVGRSCRAFRAEPICEICGRPIYRLYRGCINKILYLPAITVRMWQLLL